MVAAPSETAPRRSATVSHSPPYPWPLYRKLGGAETQIQIVYFHSGSNMELERLAEFKGHRASMSETELPQKAKKRLKRRKRRREGSEVRHSVRLELNLDPAIKEWQNFLQISEYSLKFTPITFYWSGAFEWYMGLALSMQVVGSGQPGSNFFTRN